jgi:hypothetical protein
VEIKDSGERRTFSTGSVRDVSEGKGRCDLLPLGVIGSFLVDEILLKIEHYIRRGDVGDLCWVLRCIGRTYYDNLYFMLLDVAKQYEDGAKKYAERNWEKGQPLHVYIDSGVRHYLKFKAGSTDEPHLRAFVWNILGAIWTHINKPEMIDLPFIKRANNDSDTECRSQLDKCARELVGIIDDLCRQINQCGLDEQMWEVYRKAKEVLGDD